MHKCNEFSLVLKTFIALEPHPNIHRTRGGWGGIRSEYHGCIWLPHVWHVYIPIFSWHSPMCSWILGTFTQHFLVYTHTWFHHGSILKKIPETTMFFNRSFFKTEVSPRFSHQSIELPLFFPVSPCDLRACWWSCDRCRVAAWPTPRCRRCCRTRCWRRYRPRSSAAVGFNQVGRSVEDGWDIYSSNISCYWKRFHQPIVV